MLELIFSYAYPVEPIHVTEASETKEQVHAALLVPRPRTIFMISRMNAGRSEGWREVTRFPSTITGLSSYSAPDAVSSSATLR